METNNPLNAPTISIVIPVYNAEGFLVESLDSVLNQTFCNWECILVDDGSTDRSSIIINDYSSHDSRFKIITQRNLGITKALNVGVENASGKYIARLDADDVCTPIRLQVQKNYLDEHKECVAVGSAALCIDEDGSRLMEIHSPLEHDAIDNEMIRGPIRATIVHSSAMIVREVFERVGGYDLEYEVAQDRDLWLRLAEVGKLANLPDVLVYYRLHESTISAAKSSAQRDNCLKSIKEACKRRNINFIEPKDWNSACLPESEVNRLRKWGWWSLSNGYLTSARKYAAKLFLRKPMSFGTWRLIYCVLRGY